MPALPIVALMVVATQADPIASRLVLRSIVLMVVLRLLARVLLDPFNVQEHHTALRVPLCARLPMHRHLSAQLVPPCVGAGSAHHLLNVQAKGRVPLAL